MVLVVGVRWASRCKDAGSPGSGTTGATEDAAARRPARPCDIVSVSPDPPLTMPGSRTAFPGAQLPLALLVPAEPRVVPDRDRTQLSLELAPALVALAR